MAGLRAVLGRFPTGVAVVTVAGGGQPLGLTIGSLVRLALEPPLVGFALAREAALHELLRDDGACAVSLLAEGQDGLAEHFARGVPPIGMWAGIATEPGRRPAAARGRARLARLLAARRGRGRDAHALRLRRGERDAGRGDGALVRVRGGYTVA